MPKVAEPELVTGTIASRPIPAQAQPQAPSAPPDAFPPPASPAAFQMPGRANAAAAPSPACGNPDALGVSRVVEIDTAGGPGFGFEHFKVYDFLREHEVVLTFDDGPWPGNTPAVLRRSRINAPKPCFSLSASTPCGIPKSSSRSPRRGTRSDRTPGHMPICRN
jgi:hypothetical protein